MGAMECQNTRVNVISCVLLINYELQVMQNTFEFQNFQNNFLFLCFRWRYIYPDSFSIYCLRHHHSCICKQQHKQLYFTFPYSFKIFKLLYVTNFPEYINYTITFYTEYMLYEEMPSR